MATAVPADTTPDSETDQYQLPFYDIVLVGEENVGKTSIYKRLENNTFSDGTISTLGVDNFERTYTLRDGRQVQVRLWDTAGAERYRAMTRSYYKNAKAVVFVYSMDKSSSLTCLNFWIEDASAYAPRDALWVFVCNKIDLPGEDQVLFEGDIQSFFHSQMDTLMKDGRPAPLRWCTSAKTSEGVNEALAETLTRIAESKEAPTKAVKEPEGSLLTPSVKLDHPSSSQPTQRSGCPC